MAIPVKLPVFEGPLDLLMHLIEKNKIDIYDIPIVEITDQYLEYVRQMDRQDLDVTSEFLVMAATLLDIKCRMLLPREKDEETGEEEGDPREELVRRLLEYKMYKYLSEELAVCREQAGVRYFREQKLPKEVLSYQPPINYDELLKGTDLESLQKVFGEVLRRKKSRRDPIRSGFGKIKREEISIDNKTLYIRAYLQAHPHTDFRALLESQESKEEVIVTFLILLELMKTQKVHIIQDTICGKILVEAGASTAETSVEEPVEKSVKKNAGSENAGEGTETAEQNGSRTPEADLISDPLPDEEEISSPVLDTEEISSPALGTEEISEPMQKADLITDPAPDTEEDSAPMQETDLITDPAPDAEEISTPMQEADQGNPETPDDSEKDVEESGLMQDDEDYTYTDDTETRPSGVTEIDRENPEEVAAAGSVKIPLTFYHRAEIVASPYTPVIPAEFSAAAESSSSDESVTAENSSTEEAAAVESCSTEEALAAESISQDEAVSQGTVSISAIADSVHDLPAGEAGSDPVMDHFSSRLWCGPSCYRTEPFRTYSGKVQTSKIRPSAVWLRARMTRLWARRCY